MTNMFAPAPPRPSLTRLSGSLDVSASHATRAAAKAAVDAANAAAGSNELQADDLPDESDASDASETMSSDSERGVCAICMDLPVAVTVMPCEHGVCVHCALQLTVKGRELPSCPFCRRKITGFEHKAGVLLGPGSGGVKGVQGGKKLAGGAVGTLLPSEPPLLALEARQQHQRPSTDVS